MLMSINGYNGNDVEKFVSRRIKSSGNKKLASKVLNEKKVSIEYSHKSSIVDSKFANIEDACISEVFSVFEADSLDEFKQFIVKLLNAKHSKFTSSMQTVTDVKYTFISNVDERKIKYVDIVNVRKVSVN